MIAYSKRPGLTSLSIEAETCSRIVRFDLKSHRSYREIPTKMGKLCPLARPEFVKSVLLTVILMQKTLIRCKVLGEQT
jgi:hypothetical protein